jgi:hypothetical protein
MTMPDHATAQGHHAHPAWWQSGGMKLVFVVGSVAIVAVGYLIGHRLLGAAPACKTTAPCKSDLLVVSSNWSAFGALFVAALAIERVIEPISDFLGPNTKKATKQAKTKIAAAKSATADKGTMAAAVQATEDLGVARQLTALATWAAATAIALVLCGGLKILLLSAIVDTTKGGQPSRWGDLLVTGLVVGAGTKPLHDLVSNIQKSSATKTDAAG